MAIFYNLNMKTIRVRQFSDESYRRLLAAGTPPFWARIMAARGLQSRAEMSPEISSLPDPRVIPGMAEASATLMEAIVAQKPICIIADYDADGATACAVVYRTLQHLGAHVSYLVPNRFVDGYGLSPAVVTRAHQMGAKVLLTVDNGIASIEGAKTCKALGLSLIITDHHLPGPVLPEADAIVNPKLSQKPLQLAGVGVAFYLMLDLRRQLRARHYFKNHKEPNLAMLLPLVAMGTLADLVPLDATNRILVRAGLSRIREGKGVPPGILALLQQAAIKPEHLKASDIGFILAPRINAAGRLDDMRLGIALLCCDQDEQAQQLAARLNAFNRQRQAIEQNMTLALADLESEDAYALAFYHESWHEGVVGLVASRLKDKLFRPVFAFAKGQDGYLKGSGRSIPVFHLKDALDAMARKNPTLFLRFGGHAMACGVTMKEESLPLFREMLETFASERLTPTDLNEVIEIL
jgi:single-stranded-DNA-specific exonuclease